MNTFQLTCFLTVAETLSFAKAARLLNVTQPAVTHQIRSLEEELNARLFKRTTRSVEITQEGLIFLNDAKNVLNIITLAKKRFEEPVVDERQFFSIGCHSHNELRLLPEILRQMADSCPMLNPVFQVVPFQHLYQLLDEEAVDVIVSFQEKGQKKIDGIYRELAQVRMAGVLPAGHPLAEKELLGEDDIRTQRLLLLDPQRCPDRLNVVQHSLAGERAVSDLLMCSSADACITLAKAGFGIAVQPDFPSLRDPALAYIPIKDVEPLSYGAYYKSVTGKPLLKAFLQLCKEYFSG
ncbi:MAG: LysR family transcriptional regulator [Lawsonibacter sp.]|jgi:DNA-binding transcriptional LysR family regulator|nr:LysR family transcriptional regulator [Lawsonibacter sp.]